jgi:hypothetical protein
MNVLPARYSQPVELNIDILKKGCAKCAGRSTITTLRLRLPAAAFTQGCEIAAVQLNLVTEHRIIDYWFFRRTLAEPIAQIREGTCRQQNESAESDYHIQDPIRKHQQQLSQQIENISFVGNFRCTGRVLDKIHCTEPIQRSQPSFTIGCR